MVERRPTAALIPLRPASTPDESQLGKVLPYRLRPPDRRFEPPAVLSPDGAV